MVPPNDFSNVRAYSHTVVDTGGLSATDVHDSYGVRPVVVLKAGTKFVSGFGTLDSPYVVE